MRLWILVRGHLARCLEIEQRDASLEPVYRRRPCPPIVVAWLRRVGCRRLEASPRVHDARISPHINAFRLGVCTTPRHWNLFCLQGSISGGAISYRPCMASAESGCQRWADGIGQWQQLLVIAGAGFSNYWAPFHVPFDISRCQDCLFASSWSAARLQAPVFTKPEQRSELK